MKILFLTDSITSMGGVQRVSSVIANELSKNHNITVLSAFKDSTNVYPINSRITLLNLNDIGLVYHFNILERGLKKINNIIPIIDILNLSFILYPRRFRRKISEFINKEQFDIVIGIQGFWAFFLGTINNKIESKAIGWQHSSFDAYYHTKNLYYWNQFNISKKLIQRLDSFVVLNEYDQARYKSAMGIDVSYIYNPKSFETSDISPINSNCFLAAGRFEYVKGYDLLIEAYKQYKTITNVPWKLNIIGEGSLKDSYIKKINEYNLENDINILSYTNDMQQMFKNSSCLLLSSRWEGMPMIVLEAMEMGVPTISFDIQGILPLIKNRKNGLIVKKYDTKEYAIAMGEISNNISLAKKLGNEARIMANDFSINKIANRWENLLATFEKK